MNGKNARAMRREGDRAILATAEAVAPALEAVAKYAKASEGKLSARVGDLEDWRGRGLAGRLKWLLVGR